MPFYGSGCTLSGPSTVPRKCSRAFSQCPSILNSSSSTPVTELHVQADKSYKGDEESNPGHMNLSGET